MCIPLSLRWFLYLFICLSIPALEIFNPFMIGDSAYAVNSVSIDGTCVSIESIDQGVISGVVHSSSTGQTIDGAKIEVWMGMKRETVTDNEGLFAVSLPIGEFTFRASDFGFIPIIEDVTVIADNTVTWNVNLTPIPVPCEGDVVLTSGDSYDFVTNVRGSFTGGDFYLGCRPWKCWCGSSK